MTDIKASIQKIQNEIQRLILALDQMMATLNEEGAVHPEDKEE